jgi:hypothetical protein
MGRASSFEKETSLDTAYNCEQKMGARQLPDFMFDKSLGRFCSR